MRDEDSTHSTEPRPRLEPAATVEDEPVYRLCYATDNDPVRGMECDRAAGHHGPHTWDDRAELDVLAEKLGDQLGDRFGLDLDEQLGAALRPGARFVQAVYTLSDGTSQLLAEWSTTNTGLLVELRFNGYPAGRAAWTRPLQKAEAPAGSAELLGALRYLVRRQDALRRAGYYNHGDVPWLNDGRADEILAAAARALNVDELDR